MSEAKTKKTDEAMRLVTALELESAALFVVQVPFLLEQQQKKIVSDEEKAFLSCLISSDVSIYTNLYATEVEKKMSLEEIKQAIHFFEGPAGKKLNQRSVVQSYEMFGLHTNEKIKEFTPSESAELEVFQRTTAGNKLLVEDILSDVALQKLIVKKNEEVIQGCFSLNIKGVH